MTNGYARSMSGRLTAATRKIFWEFLNGQPDYLKTAPKKGESLNNVRKRVYEFLSEIDKAYDGKTIVIVSHEMPLTVLEWTLKGMELAETWKNATRER